MALTRRGLLAGAGLAALSAACAHQGGGLAHTARRVEPFPLSRVRLKPSHFADAVDANRRYLHALSPDRLLSNYRLYAGLTPKAEQYGGWEADTIAGHTVGHYLSACALMHAQTGDEECARRVDYIVAELAECQAAGGDGYVAGFTRTALDLTTIESGRRVFEEVAAGDIRPARFYLNGSWAPLYNWHKLFAGLFDAQTHCGNEAALPIAMRLGGYIESKLGGLSDVQMQQVLSCEHGGMNEMFAELFARTGDARWRVMAEKIYHRAILEPLAQQRDELAFNHANTQIPKLIGLSRLHDVTGEERYHNAASFFWDSVTATRTYVIGGNSDREYFQEPNSLSKYITEQTCESCNTYNMMKLTRALYAKRPEARYFDYYERAHLNHIMAQHRVRDGMFAYMVPLMSGSAREWSEAEGSFWCCVGSGMESHAKHGESIYWRDGEETLYVNLFIPSELDWTERGARVSIDTRYPYAEQVRIVVDALERPQRFTMALRAPGWVEGATLFIGEREYSTAPDGGGYLRITRDWRAGDVVELRLPLALRVESTPDDTDTIALLRGPLVLAADVGAASDPYAGVGGALDPAFVADDVLAQMRLVDGETAHVRSAPMEQIPALDFHPFYALTDRRTAVYFKRFTPAQWRDEQARVAAEAARQRELDARSLDVARLGDEADEQARHLTSAISYPVSYRRRTGRDARTDGFFEFDVSLRGYRSGALALKCAYWGGEREKHFSIAIDGVEIATQRLDGEASGRFIEVDYAIPDALVAGKRRVRVRVAPIGPSRAGPMFGARVFRV